MSPRVLAATLLFLVLPGAAVAAVEAPLAPPTFGWAALRLLGALFGVGLLLLATPWGYRWIAGGRARLAGVTRVRNGRPGFLARWMAAPPRDPDRLEIASRSFVGARESICVVHVGSERFLVGITAGSVALLSRLEPAVADVEGAPGAPGVAGPPGGGAREPAPADFARTLARALAPRESLQPEDLSDRGIRDAVARSRERLASLRGRPVIPAGDDRG